MLTLKEWRRAKGVSQEELANLCGVHVNTYRTWEENASEIKLSKAALIAERLGISLSDISFDSNVLQNVLTERGA